MAGNLIYIRTELGDREVVARGAELAHDCWLALVMVDGQTSATQLESDEPTLYEVASSLKWLLEAGYIEAVNASRLKSRTSVESGRIEPRWSMPATAAHRSELPPAQRVVRRHSSSAKQRGKLQRGIIKWGKRSVMALPIAAAATTLVVLFAPLSPSIPTMEQMLAEKLDEPVKISGLDFTFTPAPALRLENVTVGHEFQVKTALIKLDWASLLEPKLGLNIEIDSLQLEPDDFAALISMRDRASKSNRTTLNHVSFRSVNIGLHDGSIGPLSGGIELAPDGRLIAAVLSHGPVTLKIEPGNRHLKVNLSAQNWEIGSGSPLPIEAIELSGDLTEHEFAAKRIEATLLGGRVSGTARFNWESGVSVAAEAELKGIDSRRLLKLMTDEFSLAGNLDAEVRLSSQASNIWKLDEEPNIEARFRIGKGALFNIDLVQAVQSSNPLGVRGGKTWFDEASGIFIAAQKKYSLKHLKIGSGVLSANGYAEWGTTKELAGRLNVVFKPKPALGNLPVQIGGTLGDPVLKPLEYLAATPGVGPKPAVRPAAGM